MGLTFETFMMKHHVRQMQPQWSKVTCVKLASLIYREGRGWETFHTLLRQETTIGIRQLTIRSTAAMEVKVNKRNSILYP